MDFWCFFVSKTVIEWKYGFLAFGGRNTNFRLQTEWLRLNDQYFIRKEFTYIESWFYNFLCFFAPKTVFLRWGGVGHQNFLAQKNRFFSFFQKCHLITFYQWIWLGNVFWGLLGRVSNNFQAAMMLLSAHVKIWIFQKNAIFAFFSDFLMLVVLDAKRHKNVWKCEFFQKHVLCSSMMLPDT